MGADRWDRSHQRLLLLMQDNGGLERCCRERQDWGDAEDRGPILGGGTGQHRVFYLSAGNYFPFLRIL